MKDRWLIEEGRLVGEDNNVSGQRREMVDMRRVARECVMLGVAVVESAPMMPCGNVDEDNPILVRMGSGRGDAVWTWGRKFRAAEAG